MTISATHLKGVCFAFFLSLVTTQVLYAQKDKGREKDKGQSEKIDPAIMAMGKKYYLAPGSCSVCHLPDGSGQYGSIPPLAQSDWLKGAPDRSIAIVLRGLSGPIKVNGQRYNSAMPPQIIFNDEQIAAIITYTRNAWGNKGSVVTAEQIAKARKSLPQGMYTAKSILKAFPFKDKKMKRRNGTFRVEDDLVIGPEIEKPFVMRTFMPGASPAAFAVALPGGQNYCWDAGESRLRYAWQQGGYIKYMKSHWSTNGKPVPIYAGKAYYTARSTKLKTQDPKILNEVKLDKPRDDTTKIEDFPIAIDGVSTEPRFLGYRLIKHHPEFWYAIGEHEIKERLVSTADHKGLIRHFQIESGGKSVTLSLSPAATCRLKSSVGTMNDKGVLHLTSEQAKSFSITMIEIQE